MIKIIAHRGNLEGPNLFHENDPECLAEILAKTDFDIEIDVRVGYENTNQYFMLGHDYGQHKIEANELLGRTFCNPRVWMHAKSIETFLVLEPLFGPNVFFHTNEDMVLTTYNHIWLYPGKERHIFKSKKDNCVLVLPELTYGTDISKWNVNDYYAVCTDYPNRLKEYLNV